MKGKFRDLTRGILSADRQEEVISTVESIESLEDVRVLARMTGV